MPFEPLTQFDFHHRLEATSGTALVVFTTPACGACRRLKAVLSETLLPGVALYEVDAGRDLALTREFEVFHLPALFLFQEGHFHGDLQTEPHPDALRLAIARRLAEPPAEAP